MQQSVLSGGKGRIGIGTPATVLAAFICIEE
jgi:hypothetical protein